MLYNKDSINELPTFFITVSIFADFCIFFPKDSLHKYDLQKEKMNNILCKSLTR